MFRNRIRLNFPRLGLSAPVVPVVAAEDDTMQEPAFDWSEMELDALSATSDADLADTRAWLKRVGFAKAVELFDA